MFVPGENSKIVRLVSRNSASICLGCSYRQAPSVLFLIRAYPRNLRFMLRKNLSTPYLLQETANESGSGVANGSRAIRSRVARPVPVGPRRRVAAARQNSVRSDENLVDPARNRRGRF